MEVCEASSSRLDPTTGALLVRCKGPSVSDDDDEQRPDYGELPFFGCPGVTSKPAPADKDGTAAEYAVEKVPGSDGIVVGGRDVRTADVIEELGDGETCLHATGKGFGSRVFCKDNLVAIVVGDDVVINIDRREQKIQIAAFEQMFEMNGKTKEINLTTGDAGLQIGHGKVIVHGELVPGKGNVRALKFMLGPITGSPGGAGSVPLFACTGMSPG